MSREQLEERIAQVESRINRVNAVLEKLIDLKARLLLLRDRTP